MVYFAMTLNRFCFAAVLRRLLTGEGRDMFIKNWGRGASIASFFLVLLINNNSYANNLSISNVALTDRNPTANTVVVEFDASWSNSWRTKINHDAVWLTVRLFDPTVSPTNKKLCNVSASGLNPTGSSVGTSSVLELYVPSDKTGAFLRRSTYGGVGSVSSADVRIKVDYSSCGFDATDEVSASIFAIEMVYVPQGEFYSGDYDTSVGSLHQGSGDADPWLVSSEGAISVTNAASDGYRYVSASQSGESSSGEVFTVPTAYPKGFQPFYAMKHEITEGQWVEFFNSLPTNSARQSRDLTDNLHKNSDSVVSRNTLSCSGTTLVCSSSRPDRSLSYLTWMDLAAFLDWAGLRPMTELEFEKMARGPLMPLRGEFAWGSTSLTAAETLSGSEDGTESVSTSGANVHYNNISLAGGDGGSGPLRAGIFASSATTRESAGAGYYGALDLSGNLLERVVTIGNATGRAFTGGHGDGYLSTVTGYEGNANVSGWVQLDATDSSRGVTGATGSGFRGGSWSDQSSGARLRISDRNQAATTSTAASNNFGGRGVRTYDGT